MHTSDRGVASTVAVAIRRRRDRRDATFGRTLATCTLLVVAAACGSEPFGSDSGPADSSARAPEDASWDAMPTIDGGTDVDAGPGKPDAASCAGPFSLRNQQPVECLPYPQSLWNKPLPAGVMNHLLPKSAAIVRRVFTQNGRYSYPWIRDQAGFGVTANTSGGWDSNAPFYYGQASDPVYRVASCSSPASGIHNPVGMLFHAPGGAWFNFSSMDTHLAVWDQTTNLLLSSYTGSSTFLKLPSCPGNGHAGTPSDPCPTSFDYCGVSNWSTDPGYGIGGDDSLGSGGWALHVRGSEMLSGRIPHALYLRNNCLIGHVFPATGPNAYVCPSGTVDEAPLGAHFFLDYTPAQLADIRSKVPLWQYELLEAMTVYGGYFGDTTGDRGAIITNIESAAAYEFSGLPYVLYDWLRSFPHDPYNADKTKPLACYSGGTFVGCDFNPYVGVPLETGPACPSAPCDVSQHLHIADPCVALGLAGKDGGCN